MNSPKFMKTKITPFQNLITTIATLAALLVPPITRADEVTDWNENMFAAVFTAKLGPLSTSRVGAMVQSAVFDAVNGVDKRHEPVHVAPSAPPGPSARAAAAQAAHDVLVNAFPSQKTTLDAQLASSLVQIAGDTDRPGQSVERGLAWGQYVASQIWAWR